MNKPWTGNDMGHKIYKVQKLNRPLYTSQMKKEKENVLSDLETISSVPAIKIKTPFSIVSEVSDFLVAPTLSETNQEVFVFNNKQNNDYRELDTQLLTTSYYYHEEPYCKLISSKIFEKRVHFEMSIQNHTNHIKDENKMESSWIPLHNLISKQKTKEELKSDIIAKFPIEIGRYKSEISLQEIVEFKEKVIEIKRVLQNVVLTKSELLLSEKITLKKKGIMAEKGTLLVEGYIFQCIEYIIEKSQSREKFHYLMQNMVLELVIQILQKQEIRV